MKSLPMLGDYISRNKNHKKAWLIYLINDKNIDLTWFRGISK